VPGGHRPGEQGPLRALTLEPTSASSWAWVSTPSAVTVAPSASAIVITPATIAALTGSSGSPSTKLRSILIPQTGCCLSQVSDE